MRPLSVEAHNPPSIVATGFLDGRDMLVNQGVISIRDWVGIDADPTVMRQKIEYLFGV